MQIERDDAGENVARVVARDTQDSVRIRQIHEIGLNASPPLLQYRVLAKRHPPSRTYGEDGNTLEPQGAAAPRQSLRRRLARTQQVLATTPACP